MNQGKIVEYIDQGRFVCAVCLQDKGTRLHLLTTSNREVNFSPKRSIIVSDATLNTERSKAELIENLRQAEARRVALKDQVDVQEIWELIQDEAEHFTHRYLAQLAFGESIADEHVSALVRALFDDRLYFKLKDGRYLANSEEVVERIVRKREEATRKEERLTEGSAWLKEVLEGNAPEAPACREEIVQLLTGLALYGNDASDFKHGKELLKRIGISDVGESRKLLMGLGVWEADENIELLRAGVVSEFGDAEYAECDRFDRLPLGTEGREDLTGLPVVTIDGPLTRDFDDAISLQIEPDRLSLGIHISDVSSAISPDTSLDLAAAERASSLYLPRKTVPMLPPELSHNALSLVEGEERRAVSLLVRFDREGNLLESRFAPSVIRVRQRLSYDQVNEWIEDDDVFGELHRLSRLLRRRRLEAGALNLSLPDLEVAFSTDGTISFEHIDQNTPSRSIVAELMILYNGLAGEFFRERKVPTLYRTQGEPGQRLPFGELGFVYYVFQQRRKLSPLQITTLPGPHVGLGVSAYTHVTSPLRRYLDLVAQRQMTAALTGSGPVYDEERLEEIRLHEEPILRSLQQIKRNRLRYWILKYLGQRRGERYKALVLDELRSKYRIVLSDLYLLAEMKRSNGMILKTGQEIIVEVGRSDPWEDTLELICRES
ncbi:MAG: RNB domain-containing ribonuclease [Deltaproteobacteria bacterium]|nr:RNB domain-containing ribonuclease [Deltaproteobacteria bacterium]